MMKVILFAEKPEYIMTKSNSFTAIIYKEDDMYITECPEVSTVEQGETIAQESLYESDFLLWTQETVAKIMTEDFDHIDFENLIEEIESLGRSEKEELENRLEIL